MIFYSLKIWVLFLAKFGNINRWSWNTSRFCYGSESLATIIYIKVDTATLSGADTETPSQLYKPWTII